MYRAEHHVTKKASHVAEDRQVAFTYHELAAAQKPTKRIANRFLISFFVHVSFHVSGSP